MPKRRMTPARRLQIMQWQVLGSKSRKRPYNKAFNKKVKRVVKYRREREYHVWPKNSDQIYPNFQRTKEVRVVRAYPPARSKPKRSRDITHWNTFNRRQYTNFLIAEHGVRTQYPPFLARHKLGASWPFPTK